MTVLGFIWCPAVRANSVCLQHMELMFPWPKKILAGLVLWIILYNIYKLYKGVNSAIRIYENAWFVANIFSLSLFFFFFSFFLFRFLPGQGLVLYPQIGDKLDIICPKVDSKTVGQYEYYKVYMVDKDQADSCAIRKDNTPLLNCAKPDQDVKFTIKFQEFSPNLWGLEFQKNKDYYVICKFEITVVHSL